jgi:hypothetical protein
MTRRKVSRMGSKGLALAIRAGTRPGRSAVKGFAMRAWIFVCVIGLANAPDAVAAPTAEQLGAAVAAVNALLPEPGPAVSAAAAAFALALLTGRGSPRRR